MILGADRLHKNVVINYQQILGMENVIIMRPNQYQYIQPINDFALI